MKKTCGRRMTYDQWHFFPCPNEAVWIDNEGVVYCNKHKPRAKWRGKIERISDVEAKR